MGGTSVAHTSRAPVWEEPDVVPTKTHEDQLQSVVDRLSAAAEADYYNPYKRFAWPDRLDVDGYWMSPELMTVHGTSAARELDEKTLQEISKWESGHFYSLNVHGIRELLIEVVRRIHTTGFEIPTKFFHHFVGEENEHMWFFAEFCLRYLGKIYPDRSMSFGTDPGSPLVQNFIVFSRILIFEEIVDYFNSRMGSDDRLHPTIRDLNKIHHEDESRHIAFGRQLVTLAFQKVCDDGTDDEREFCRTYTRRFLDSSIAGLYSPAVYRDAGVTNPTAFRREVMNDPARAAANQAMSRCTTSFFHRIDAMAAA